MEFLILGELEVRHDGLEVPIKGALQRKALAVLLLESGRTVPMHRLIDALWDGEPPATARRQVRNIVAAARRTIAADDPIERSGDGYRLLTDATDWNDFRTEVAKAKTAGEPAETHRSLRQALQRWRGPVLAGLDSAFIAAAALHMDEERIAAYEDFHEAGLALGLHREMTGDLQSLIAAHPYRQRLNGQLMLALYRSGNGAAALRLYTALGERLADELGIEPDRRLRDLYVAILREDPSLDLDPAIEEPPQRSEPAVTDHVTPGALEAPLTRKGAASGPPPDLEPLEAKRDSRLAARSFSRQIALGLVVFAVVVATSGDGRGLALLEGDSDRTRASVASGNLGDLLWTYPALASGSAVMKVDAGLLVLDGGEVHLESGSEVLWRTPMDSQSIPRLAVFSDTVVISSSPPIDQPWSTGTMSAVNLDSGKEIWSTRDWWPVARTEESIIAVGCETGVNGAAGACAMESIDPRSGLTQWHVGLGSRPIPLRTEAPYDSPWDQNLSTDYLMFRTLPGAGEGHIERLSVYDIDTGTLVGEFDYNGVEVARISEEVLMMQESGVPVAEGACEARLSAYDLGAAELIWERFVDTPADGDTECLLPWTVSDAGNLLPATVRQTASVFWVRSGELQWAVPEPSTAELLIDDSFVTTDTASGDLAVWDAWRHEQRWTANRGEMLWARGSTLWVLDREAIGPDCGGMVGYSLETGESVRLPGSLVYLSEDEVVTADNGTWKAWTADPWG